MSETSRNFFSVFPSGVLQHIYAFWIKIEVTARLKIFMQNISLGNCKSSTHNSFPYFTSSPRQCRRKFQQALTDLTINTTKFSDEELTAIVRHISGCCITKRPLIFEVADLHVGGSCKPRMVQ